MLNLIFDSSLKIIKKDIPLITQYSEVEIIALLPYNNLEHIFSFSLVRPDGYKANEVYFECGNEFEPGLYEWTAKIRSYHTLSMPGTQDIINIIVGFTLKNIIGGLVQSVKSSPIIRIPVVRSVEPAPNELEPEIADDFEHRISVLELADSSHNLISSYSRSLPNQHPIAAITGLEQEVGVYTGIDEPEKGERTWLETVSEESEVIEWQTLLSSPTISLGATYAVSMPYLAPVRLVVSGNLFGETYIQEIYSGVDPSTLSGEVIIYVDEDILNSISVRVAATITTNLITITEFKNTGALDIDNFIALRFEVYN